MSDVMEDRRSLLDAFANSQPTDNSQALATVTRAAPPDVVYGSREVSTRRDESGILQRIRVLAAAAGSSWYYRYPVKNRKLNRTDWIEGPSIELALDIARIYGNCHVDCRAEDYGNVILFHARFHDVESGFSLTRPFQQRRGAAKMGGGDEGRNAEIDFSIGASKAIRNVVVNALKTYANFAFEEAREAIVEKIGKNIERWRADTVAHLKVDLPRVEMVIGRPASAWLAPDIARVRAMGKAIEDGMATWDETFPPLGGRKDETLHEALDAGHAALDKFASDAASTASGGDEADAGAQQTAASASAPRAEIIDKLLHLAAEKSAKQDRLEVLDVTSTMLGDLYPADAAFVKEAVLRTSKIINDDMKPPLARKYLEGLA